MPGTYRPIVPNGYSESNVMLAGSGLELAGSGYSLKKTLRALDDENDDLEGEGFGKGTQKKLMRGAKKAARVGEALVNEFGTNSQKKKVATARKVTEVISGSGKGIPAARLRQMVERGGGG